MAEDINDPGLLSKNNFVALQGYLVAAREVVHTAWRKITGDWIFSVHAADLNQDGKVKIIAGSEDRRIYLLDIYGQVLWSFEAAHRVRSVYSADLNQDGVHEIIAGSEDQNLYILDANGKLLSRLPLDSRINQVKAADLDGDGQVEIVCGLENGLLVILGKDGTRKLTFTAQSSITALTLVPATDPGQMVLVVGLTTGEVIAVDSLGQAQFRYQADGAVLCLDSLPGSAGSAASIALATANGKFSLINERGREVWQRDLAAKVYSVAFGHVGRDREPGLVVGLEDQTFHVYTLQGQREWSHLTEDWVLSLCIYDVNGDGVDEIIAGQGDSTVTLYTYKRQLGLLDNISGTYQLARGLLSEIEGLSEIDVKNLYALTRGKFHLPTVILPSKTPSFNEALTHLRGGDFDSAISALVEIEQRGFSCEWCQSIGAEGSWLFSLCTADINNDGLAEISVACSDGKIYAFDLGGKLLWTYAIPFWFFDVTVADLDQDGQNEIIAGADRSIYVLRGDGQLLRKYETPDRVWTVNCVDINDDGDLEIVAGLDNGSIQILSAKGELLKRLQVSGKVRDLRVHDLNNDGSKELIVSSTDNQVHLISFADDRTLATYPLDKEGWSYRVRCQDIDGDGLSEVVATARNNRVHVLNEKGELKWKYYCADWITGLGIADIDGDGSVELILGRHDGFVSVVNAVGDLCWDFQITSWVRSVDVGDWDGDGLVEFAIGTGNGKLFYFKAAHHRAIRELLDQCLNAKSRATGWSNERLIEHYIEAPDPYLQSYAVRQLPTLQLDTEHLIAEIVRVAEGALDADKNPVILSCLALIGLLDSSQDNRLPILLKRLSMHRDLQVRSEVVSTLDRLAIGGQSWATDLLLSLTKDLNPTLRRNVARVLKQHSSPDAKPIIRTLSQMCLDDDDWVRHEAVRSLAYACDRWPDATLLYVSRILSAGCGPALLREMAGMVENPMIRERLQGLYGQLTADIGTSLMRFFKFLSQAQAIQTVDQIALLQEQIGAWTINPTLRAEFTTSLGQLLPLVQDLQSSQRLVNPADKTSALTFVGERMANISEEIAGEIAGESKATTGSVLSVILLILRDVLDQWSEVVSKTRQNISQEALLEVQLRSKDVQWSDEIEILFELQNIGKGVAGDVELEVKPSAEYEVVADFSVVKINQLTAKQTELCTLRLRPRTTHALTIMLEVRYEDALGPKNFYKSEKITFGQPLPFKHIAPNPYLPGTAVSSPGSLFVGRGDVLQYIKESLERGGSNVVILTGRLRVGKTSILYQLEHTVGDHYVPIYIDMEARMEKRIDELLFALATLVARGLQRRGFQIDSPLLEDFQQSSALSFAEDFLGRVKAVVGNRQLLLLMDEFGALETAVRLGLDRSIFGYMRSLFQHSDIKFVLVVAETSAKATLSEQWQGIFNISLHKRIGLLTREATTDLVTLPVKDYNLLYDSLSLDQIYRTTGGHPYLVQSLCFNLVEVHNQAHMSYMTINEVSSALNKVLEQRDMYLRSLWHEWDSHQQIVLFLLTRLSDKQILSADLDTIVSEAGDIHLRLQRQEASSAIGALVAEEIVDSILVSDRRKYSFRIGLIRQWINQNISLEDLQFQLE